MPYGTADEINMIKFHSSNWLCWHWPTCICLLQERRRIGLHWVSSSGYHVGVTMSESWMDWYCRQLQWYRYVIFAEHYLFMFVCIYCEQSLYLRFSICFVFCFWFQMTQVLWKTSMFGLYFLIVSRWYWL